MTSEAIVINETAILKSGKDGLATAVKPADWLIEEYGRHDYTPEQAVVVELAAVRIRQLSARATKDMVDIGGHLTAVRDEMPHGQWQFFVETRSGLSIRTAQNFMAAFSAYNKFPALNEYRGQIHNSAAQIIGSRKTIDDDVVSEIIAIAEEGEVSAEIVNDILARRREASGEVRDQKVQESKIKVSTGMKDALVANTRVNARIAFAKFAEAGVTMADIKKVRKSGGFKGFIKEIASGDDLTETQTALMTLMVLVYDAVTFGGEADEMAALFANQTSETQELHEANDDPAEDYDLELGISGGGSDDDFDGAIDGNPEAAKY